MIGIDIYDITATSIYGRYRDEVFTIPIDPLDFVKVLCKDKRYFIKKMSDAYMAYYKARDNVIEILKQPLELMSDSFVRPGVKTAFDTMRNERKTWIKYKMLETAMEFVDDNYKLNIYKEKWLE